MKGSTDKKKIVTPVILIEEGAEDLTNTLIIGQMLKGEKENSSSLKAVSNIFGGGFKQPTHDNHSKNMKAEANPSSIKLPKNLDKFTVYDEFGLINDSIGKKKYR